MKKFNINFVGKFPISVVVSSVFSDRIHRIICQ